MTVTKLAICSGRQLHCHSYQLTIEKAGPLIERLEDHYQAPDKRPCPDRLNASDKKHYAMENYPESEVSQRPAHDNQGPKNDVIGDGNA